MNIGEIRRLAESWVKLHHLPEEAPERDVHFWAFAQLNALVRDEPELAWQVAEAIRQLDISDQILANLAAGPIEDLLALHGEEFIDRVEALAQQDAVFKKMLGAVWRNDISDSVWRRLRAVAGPSF